MANLGPRLSTACLYNMQPSQSQPERTQTGTPFSSISPVSTLQTPISDERHVAISPVEKAAYYPDDKICMTAGEGLEVYTQAATPSDGTLLLSPPKYEAGDLPERTRRPPFWRRHLCWIVAGAVVFIILIGLLVGLLVSTHHGKESSTQTKAIVTNSTKNSVASSGLFLNGGKQWNMHIFAQNETGDISLQISLDGNSFNPANTVPLQIKAKIGSPLTATAEQDTQTGVIMLNLFYLSGDGNITMTTMACASGSLKCNMVMNFLLPTNIPAHENTGLSAVNVNNDEDWRVYYHDNQGFISQLQGNASGFNEGERIGGSGLNSTSIAAVNTNSTTNNIVLFYVDSFSSNLFTMQFTNGAWTTPLPVSSSFFDSWNPHSGLGAAYSPVLDQLQVYFTGNDTRIYQYIGSNASKTTSTVWSTQPSSQRIWAHADYVGADVTAVGWKDQVRFFQVSQGKTVQGILNNQTWTESFIA